MKFDGIILDIDGTIWNTTEVVAEAWNNAISKTFPETPDVNADILKKEFGKTMKVIADDLFKNLNDDEKKILMEQCCEEEHYFIRKNTKNITYEGVVETIKILSKSVPVFIVSNCQSGYIELVIEKNHLENYITDFECYGNTGKNKDENIALVIKRNCLLNPVYVGDTKGDEDACRKINVPFIWASYGFGYSDFYYKKIDSFSDLKNIIEE